MRNKIRPMILAFLFPALVSAFVLGCSGNHPVAGTLSDDQTPVTLSILAGTELPTDVLGLVKKKFPNYTINVITPGPATQLSNLVAQNQVPDIIDAGAYDLNHWNDLGLNYDLTPLINKYKVDLSRYNQQFLQVIRSFSGNGELDALPYYQWINVLFYNKDLFDKFGVPYPKDGIHLERSVGIGQKNDARGGWHPVLRVLGAQFFRLCRTVSAFDSGS